MSLTEMVALEVKKINEKLDKILECLKNVPAATDTAISSTKKVTG
jgi:hypothetical protein